MISTSEISLPATTTHSQMAPMPLSNWLFHTNSARIATKTNMLICEYIKSSPPPSYDCAHSRRVYFNRMKPFRLHLATCKVREAITICCFLQFSNRLLIRKKCLCIKYTQRERERDAARQLKIESTAFFCCTRRCQCALRVAHSSISTKTNRDD